MKSFWAVFFVSLYLLAMAKPVMPLFDYIINQDYIAEFLCVNKDNTELKCNGKCYLMQRLQEQNNEKQKNLPRIAMEEYPIGFVELFSVLHKSSIKISALAPNGYFNDYYYLYSYIDYHPPISLV